MVKTANLSLSEGPSIMMDPELPGKTGFFPFRQSNIRSGLRSCPQLALFVSRILRRRNGGRVGIMPGFLRIMPGIRGRMMHQGHAPDHATVGECRPEKYCSLLGFHSSPYVWVVRHLPDLYYKSSSVSVGEKTRPEC